MTQSPPPSTLRTPSGTPRAPSAAPQAPSAAPQAPSAAPQAPSAAPQARSGPAIDPVLVIGLGNPGPAYSGNRHNVGAMIADVLAGRIGGQFASHKAGADVLEGRLAGARTILGKPRSYMNLSGGAAAGLARYFKIEPASIVVIHDELDLPAQTIRVKLGGGEGGHNGLRSISNSLGSKDYLRVRFGIGRPPGRQDPADYVLKDFSGAERKELPIDLENAADAVELLIRVGLLDAQNQLH